MGLLFHFNFKGETSHTESSELNHTPGVPGCGRCMQGKPGLGFSSRRWRRGQGCYPAVGAGPRASAGAASHPRSAWDWLVGSSANLVY